MAVWKSSRVLSLILAVVLMAGTMVFPQSASATFTTPEISSLQRLFFSAAFNLHDGVNSELIPVLKDGTTDVTRPKIAEVYRLIILAQSQVALGIADLVGGSYYPNDPNPRSYFVTRAFGYFDAADATMEQAKVAVTACIAAGCDGYLMGRLRDIRIRDALVNLRAFNRTLTYADPYPILRTISGRMPVGGAGPHGNYDEAQNRLRGAIDFLITGYQATINAYKSDALLPGYWSLSQQAKFASLLYVQNVLAMATVAGIYLNTAEQNQHPFFRLLDRMETISHGGGGTPCFASGQQLPGDPCHGSPYNYNNFIQRTLDSVSAWPSRPTFQYWQTEAITRLNQSWDNNHTALWFMLRFPEGDVPAPPPPEPTPISFVGSAAAQASSVVLPAHQAGDLLLVLARSSSLTQPTLPAGWTSIQVGSADHPGGAFDVSARLGFKIAESDAETSGTWTDASFVTVHVYRGASGVGGSAIVTGTTSPSEIPAVTLTVTDGSSWVAGFLASRNAPNPQSGPAGLTLRQVGTPGVPRIYSYDTDGAVSEWLAASFTHSGAAHVSIAVELVSE